MPRTNEQSFAMFRAIREHIDTVFREDPAAKSKIEILLCYPGFQAILLHRFSHRLYQWGVPLVPRVLSQMSRFFTTRSIHFEVFVDAKIGRYQRRFVALVRRNSRQDIQTLYFHWK